MYNFLNVHKVLYHIWKIKYYNDIEDDDDNDVMRCQEMSRHQEDIGAKNLLLETTFLGGNLKTWFLIMELTFPVGMDQAIRSDTKWPDFSVI